MPPFYDADGRIDGDGPLSGQAPFDVALSIVLSHEGGFVNDPDDPGGATKFGISLRWLKEVGELDLDRDGHPDGDINLDGHVNIDDIKGLTRDNARWFYKAHWWDPFRYAELPDIVAIKVFDLAVNMGSRQAHRCLQRGVRAAGIEIADDGILGPNTRSAVQTVPSHRLHAALRSEAAGFYRSLVSAKPAMGKYLKGWLNRAYA